MKNIPLTGKRMALTSKTIIQGGSIFSSIGRVVDKATHKIKDVKQNVQRVKALATIPKDMSVAATETRILRHKASILGKELGVVTGGTVMHTESIAMAKLPKMRGGKSGSRNNIKLVI